VLGPVAFLTSQKAELQALVPSALEVVFILNPCRRQQGRLMTSGSLPVLVAAAACRLALPAS